MVLSTEVTQNPKVLDDIVKSLNEKFDPTELYYHTRCEKMFAGTYLTQGDISTWNITFIGKCVMDGALSTNEKYIPLTEDNERKILMLTVSKTISVIKEMVTFISMMDISATNKNELIEILEKSAEDENAN